MTSKEEINILTMIEKLRKNKSPEINEIPEWIDKSAKNSENYTSAEQRMRTIETQITLLRKNNIFTTKPQIIKSLHSLLDVSNLIKQVQEHIINIITTIIRSMKVELKDTQSNMENAIINIEEELDAMIVNLKKNIELACYIINEVSGNRDNILTNTNRLKNEIEIIIEKIKTIINEGIPENEETKKDSILLINLIQKKISSSYLSKEKSLLEENKKKLTAIDKHKLLPWNEKEIQKEKIIDNSDTKIKAIISRLEQVALHIQKIANLLDKKSNSEEQLKIEKSFQYRLLRFTPLLAAIFGGSTISYFFPKSFFPITSRSKLNLLLQNKFSNGITSGIIFYTTGKFFSNYLNKRQINKERKEKKEENNRMLF